MNAGVDRADQSSEWPGCSWSITTSGLSNDHFNCDSCPNPVKVASEVRWPKTTQALPPVDVDWCSVPDDLEIVAEGLDFPEGPIACADGTLLVVEVRGGRLMRVFPTGGLEIVADLGGGPNGAALGPDGAIYICNNGGLPWSQLDDGSWYPVDRRTGSMTPAGYAGGWIERVDPSSGDITRLIERVDGTVLSAPNDIAFDRAGDLWFTDTGKTGIGTTVLGAVYRARADGSEVERFATGLLGPNGIGFAPTADRVYVSDTPRGVSSNGTCGPVKHFGHRQSERRDGFALECPVRSLSTRWRWTLRTGSLSPCRDQEGWQSFNPTAECGSCECRIRSRPTSALVVMIDKPPL